MKIDFKLRNKCLVLRVLSLLLLISFFLGQASASQISGKVVGISDGDTITVLQNKQQYKIRLYRVDCPESGQAFGQKAKEFTSSMVFGKNVEVSVYDVDTYGRSVGVVRINGMTVLKSGFAWLYTKYCKQSFCGEWKVLEEQASKKRAGLWADKHPMPPWDWRKAERGGGQKILPPPGDKLNQAVDFFTAMPRAMSFMLLAASTTVARIAL